MSSGQSAARNSGKAGVIVCLAPDVCLTPVGPTIVPLPYMILSRLDQATRTEATVTFADNEAFTLFSRTKSLTGDEAGVGGGVISGVITGWCRPRAYRSSVVVGGHELIHNGHLFDMNCAGPEGIGNTVGRLVYYDEGPA
jgi:hypothetical protein